MKTIRDLTNRVEEAHTKHLQEVKSLEEQTRNVSAKDSPLVSNQPITDDSVSFESLVQGSKGSHEMQSSNDMFDSLVGNTNKLITPQQKPISATSTWSVPSQSPSVTSATLQPQSVTNSNGWNTNLQQTSLSSNTNNNNTWVKPIAPITSSVSATNTWNNNSAMTNTTWSQPIKPISSPSMSQTPLKPIAPPGINMAMNQMSLNNKSNSSSNYDALRSFSSGAQQPSMMPLSANMGLLKPITPNVSTTPIQNNAPHMNKANLHAFDPLG